MGILDKLTNKPPNPPAYNQSNTTNPYPSTTNNQNQPSNNYYSNNGSANVGPGNAPSSDGRPLPPGWEKQWHEGYQRYFYVDTRGPNGPESHWTHPYDQSQEPTRAPIPQNTSYQLPGPPQTFYNPQQQQPIYHHQQQPQPMAPIQPTNARRAGGVNPLLAGAGGLAGGMLLGSMLEGHHHHHDNGYMSGYEQGYENGYDNGLDNGDDWGGGDDFGGGDFF